VGALPRVGVLVEVGAVELGEREGVPGKCAGTQSRMTPIPRWWRWSTNQAKSSGVPNRWVGAKKPVTW
jgi:hypothetical protein